MFYEAVFQPSEQMDYNVVAKTFAGKRIAIQEGWTVAKGPFKGQPCFYVPSSTMGWIPQCDLKEIKSVPHVRWRDLLNSMELEN